MSARKERRGGRRRGAGRPKGTGGPPELRRRNRVVVLLTDAEFLALRGLAERSDVPVGTLAYEFIQRELRKRLSPD